MTNRVQHIRGVPRWFSYSLHLVSRRQCRKVGHLITSWPDVCDHCGQIFEKRS
jgi:hypothetical protein